MRALNTEECAQVSGGGAFSYVTSIGLFALSATASFFVGGPAGVVATVAIFGVGTGANVMYDVANEGRENKRVKNDDR